MPELDTGKTPLPAKGIIKLLVIYCPDQLWLVQPASGHSTP